MSEIIINYLSYYNNDPRLVKLVAKLYGINYYQNIESLILELKNYDKILERMPEMTIDPRYSLKDYEYVTQGEILNFMKNEFSKQGYESIFKEFIKFKETQPLRKMLANSLGGEIAEVTREKYYQKLLKTDLLADNISYYNYQNPVWNENRQKNEDRFAHLVTDNVKMFAVFDGHGGQLVSQYLSMYFLNYIEEKIKNNKNANISEILNKSFKNFNKFFKISQGSTATVILIYNDVLYCANCGDTIAAIMIPFNKKVLLLSEIHSPESEVTRLGKINSPIKNGRIKCKENKRVNMSRSFGDYHCQAAGMISYCSISSLKLINNRNYHILICSDGLYTKDKALDYATKFFNYIITEPKNEEINLAESLTSPNIIDDKTISYIYYMN